MKTKTTKTIESQAVDFLKSIELTISNASNYVIRNQKQFESVKKLIQEFEPEVTDSQVMKFSEFKCEELHFALNLKKSITEQLDLHKQRMSELIF
jgi:predicted transcriptional regulator